MMKYSIGEKIFLAFNYFALIIFSLVFLIPFVIVISSSFVGPEEFAVRGSYVFYPHALDFGAYKLIFNRGSIIISAYTVTFFRVFVGTFLNLAFTATLAYVLAQRGLPGRTGLTLFVFFTIIFGGGLIPTFMLVDSLGLRNSVWALIWPGLINAFWLLIMRNFFMAIPGEIVESAVIDGASPLVVLLRIVLPLALPSLVTIGLFYAVWHWNQWFDAAIYIDQITQQPMQLILRNVLQIGNIADSSGASMTLMDQPPPPAALKSALIVVSTLPILLVYPFIQRYFVKGAMVGSVKG